MVQAKAVSIDCTKSFMSNYKNPFSLSNISHRHQVDQNIMTETLNQKKKFKNINEIADEDDDEDGNQGKKCRNFKFESKLESLGTREDFEKFLKKLAEQSDDRNDIHDYDEIRETHSGYPIYLQFEVLYVRRKTLQDKEQQLIDLTRKIKMFL